MEEALKIKNWDLPKAGVNQDLLDFAPPEVFEEYLSRIQEELIPQKNLKTALKLLTMMLKSGLAQQEPELKKRIDQVLLECNDALLEKDTENPKLLRLSVWERFSKLFPNIREYKDPILARSEEIIENRSIIVPATT